MTLLRSFLFSILLSVPAIAQVPKASLNGCPWRLAPAPEVAEAGEKLSTPGYPDKAWLHAKVPGTAFVDYINAGLEPEPSYGENGKRADVKKYDRNYWYRTEFTVPLEYFKGGRIWLNLDGVHRDGEVFLNGTRLGSLKGHHQRGRYDVTNLVKAGSKNSLAVLVCPMALSEEKNKGNSSAPAILCSRGWDWMPRVPGLNVGLYKDVYLTHTGSVSLLDPWIRSDLPKPTEAILSVQVEVANATASPVTGELVGEINPGKVAFKKSVTLKPDEVQKVVLSPETCPALRIVNPKLWWPNGYGAPNLYTARVAFTADGKTSDEKSLSFGIRKYSYQTENKILHFSINGVRLFLKGGSWGPPEFLMRRRSVGDYETALRLHREMNFNLVRNWMGATPDEAFYNACDKYGIMVWDEFWIDSHGGLVSDLKTYFANATEKIKQVRNHPSIALWCCMNEGTPPPEETDPLAEIVKTFDGGDRKYIPNSARGDDHIGGDKSDNNISGSGPWYDLDLKNYFTGVMTKRGVEMPFGLRSELGMATFTSFDSFKKFIPKENWWPRNPMWKLHFFAGGGKPDIYQFHLGERYGQASDIEDWCRKAQLLNLETMKAIFEGWLDHSDTDASGMVIWMSHPAYPVFVWQTYDYYYDTTGSYWGAKTACEPVHIYWNSNDERVRVVNTSGKAFARLKADVWVYNLDGSERGRQTAMIDALCDKVADCFTLSIPQGVTPTHFLKLRLTSASGVIVSENFYWRGAAYADYFALSSLKPVQLQVSKPSAEPLEGGMTRLTLDITNPHNSGAVAFAIRPKLVKPNDGSQILPVFMNDGYFSLVPGETKRVTIEYNPANVGSETPKLEVEIWNNAPHPTPQKPPPLPPEPPRKKLAPAQTTGA